VVIEPMTLLSTFESTIESFSAYPIPASKLDSRLEHVHPPRGLRLFSTLENRIKNKIACFRTDMSEDNT